MFVIGTALTFEDVYLTYEKRKKIHSYSEIATNSDVHCVNDLTIVIPAYNEEDRIVPTLTDILGNISGIKEIIVVCDGKDNTPDVARSFGSKVRVLEFSCKLGRGGAILEGFKAANSGTICFVDADNSVPWYEIVRLSQMVNKSNPVVVGSRWTAGSKVVKKESTPKIIAGRGWHYLVMFLTGIHTKDVQCGLKFFEGEFLKELIPTIKTTNRMFDVSILYNSKIKGKEIHEVGIEWSHNENTRMPYIHVIPVMFLYLLGLKFAHSHMAKYFGPFLNILNSKFNEIH